MTDLVESEHRPAAVLFDMDGTLLDSERVWDIGLRELAWSYGGELSDAARVAMVGGSMATSMAILHNDIAQPWRDAETSAEWLITRMAELYQTELRWQPGARELLDAVHDAGIPTALVTNTGRHLVDIALGVIGGHWFDAVVCGDEVSVGKPDPEPYLMAARLLGVPVERSVAIEDSPVGVTSALAAGAAVIAVPHDAAVAPRRGLHIVDSLTAVDLPLLADLADRAVPTP
ncbi:phosphoglycolate phosphatase [Asanoa ishikariensis]|uniref:Haloacid dehalogenase superfamily, subfamily IA, variant 3 with third motif having DD or ED n=1 Tax=Asanoa ishikariensis TaxID=137265 RepID=A0A1H3TVK5_9ACTN|nr:phosphoglycolate phosphatase [Asanoa ishikariensis]SDZ53269.1 haloacid dehalogenase superfamily, subfamily IA, variant 3 with third motif having DD or ED [Asanoa ishikariensis]